MVLWVVVNPLVMLIIFIASIVEQIVNPLQYDAYQNVSVDTAVYDVMHLSSSSECDRDSLIPRSGPGDYKHWTRDPRTGDPRTRGPGTQGPETQRSSSVALSFYDRMQLVSMF